MNNRKFSVLQHGAQRGSKESNTRTLNNEIRQTKNKYQKIKSRNTKALNKVASVTSSSSIKMRSSLTLAQEAEMYEKRKARSAQFTQSRLDLTNASQNSTFTKSPNEMSSTQAGSEDLLDQASSINLQAKAYEQATKKMNERILELTSYVDAMKKTNTSDNFVPSSSSSLLIQQSLSISQKEIQKEIDRMLKIMPSFNGDSEDNFESWQLSTKQCFSYGRNCSEQQKIDVVLAKIGGHAIQTLEYEGELNTIETIFKSLKRTYGQDQRAIISQVKQLPTETVKLYSVRLKNNLRDLGICVDHANPGVIALDYFVSGLLPAISKQVKSLLPETYLKAEGYAFQIECENMNSMSKRIDSINNLVQKDGAMDLLNDVRSSTSFNSNNINNEHKLIRPYFGTCFGCNTQGHTFWNCPSITNKKRKFHRLTCS